MFKHALLFLLIPAFLTAQTDTAELLLVQPYLQFGTQTSMHVLWETAAPASTAVFFGEARLGVEKAILDDTVRLAGYRHMHEVPLEQLKPETNYFWQIATQTADGRQVISPVYTFKTAVKDSSSFMFALIGDTQRNSGTPWAWGKIAEKVWADRPNFVVLAGDLVDKGMRKSDWLEDFFPKGHILMSRVPVYPVLGNHEQDAPYYYQYVVAPAPEYYYTFHYGNAQFFMLDSNRDLSEGSEQYNWLEWELAQSTATWKIAVHHHPPYSSDSNDHGDTDNALSTLGVENPRNLIPLYEKYGLDFSLFGHTHLYERTWPIKEDRINMKEGVVYINSGGAGGYIEEFAPTRSWFTQELEKGHHYCTFAIFDNNLVFKAIDHEGRLFDQFQMAKSEVAPGQTAVVQPPAPKIEAGQLLFESDTWVSMSALDPNWAIRYTTDGSRPNLQSQLYTEPLRISQNTDLQATVYTPEGKVSRVASIRLRKGSIQKAVSAEKSLTRGLQYQYYEGQWEKLPDFSQLTPIRSGQTAQVSLSDIPHAPDHFALVIEGYVAIPNSGLHTFFINSDDGSKLYLNGQLLIDHDGDHSAIAKQGQALLEQGKHHIRIEYMERRGGEYLQAGIVDPEKGVMPFAPFVLYRD